MLGTWANMSVNQSCLCKYWIFSKRDLALFDIYDKLFRVLCETCKWHFLWQMYVILHLCQTPYGGISTCICMNISEYIWNENCRSDCRFVPSNLEVCSLTMFTWDLNIFQDIEAWLFGLTWIMELRTKAFIWVAVFLLWLKIPTTSKMFCRVKCGF